jgi:hypothetical protein
MINTITMLTLFKNLCSISLKFMGIVFITCFSHWTLVNIYTGQCAPFGLFGALQTFVNLGSPFCQFINMVQYELARHYITIWTLAGTAIISWFIAKTSQKNK